MLRVRRISELLFISSLLVLGWGNLFADLVECAALGRSRRRTDSQRSIRFRNQSGRRTDIFWVNTFKEPNEFVTQSIDGEGYLYGADTSISSFIGHEFEVREQPSKKTGRCVYDECRKARFKVNDQENQEITVERNFVLTLTDDRQRAVSSAKTMFESCQAATEGLSLVEAIEAIATCMQEQVNETLAVHEEERDFQFSVREGMARDLVPYACGAVNYTETEEMNNITWHYKEGDVGHRKYDLQIMHDRPTSQILVIDGFTTKEFCDAVKVYVQDNKVPFLSISENTVQGTLLFQLATKIYELGKVFLSWNSLDFLDTHRLGYPLFDVFKDEVGIDVPSKLCIGDETETLTNCRLPGAAPFAATTKRIAVENPSQVANVFLFCDEPKTLGALHFPYANIHVKPQVGRLVMAINRRRREDKEMDGYVGEYHLCPNHDVYMHTFAEKA
jgi:hypothetical protein